MPLQAKILAGPASGYEREDGRAVAADGVSVAGASRHLVLAEAAERLGVSGRRIRQLIDEDKLPAQYVGGGYVIEESVLESVKVYGKPGRPPKAKPAPVPKATTEKQATATGKKKGANKRAPRK